MGGRREGQTVGMVSAFSSPIAFKQNWSTRSDNPEKKNKLDVKVAPGYKRR